MLSSGRLVPFARLSSDGLHGPLRRRFRRRPAWGYRPNLGKETRSRNPKAIRCTEVKTRQKRSYSWHSNPPNAAPGRGVSVWSLDLKKTSPGETAAHERRRPRTQTSPRPTAARRHAHRSHARSNSPPTTPASHSTSSPSTRSSLQPMRSRRRQSQAHAHSLPCDSWPTQSVLLISAIGDGVGIRPALGLRGGRG